MVGTLLLVTTILEHTSLLPGDRITPSALLLTVCLGDGAMGPSSQACALGRSITDTLLFCGEERDSHAMTFSLTPCYMRYSALCTFSNSISSCWVGHCLPFHIMFDICFIVCLFVFREDLHFHILERKDGQFQARRHSP